MDPVSLSVGAALFAAGCLVGRHTRTRQRQRYMCTCKHPVSDHDPQTNACHARDRMGGILDPRRFVPCTCRQYTGDRPLPDPEAVLRSIPQQPDPFA